MAQHATRLRPCIIIAPPFPPMPCARRWTWEWVLAGRALGRALAAEASCSTCLKWPSSSEGAAAGLHTHLQASGLWHKAWFFLRALLIPPLDLPARAPPPCLPCPLAPTAAAPALPCLPCSNDAIAVAAGKAMEARSLLPGLPRIDTRVLEAAKMGAWLAGFSVYYTGRIPFHGQGGRRHRQQARLKQLGGPGGCRPGVHAHGSSAPATAPAAAPQPHLYATPRRHLPEHLVRRAGQRHDRNDDGALHCTALRCAALRCACWGW